jgi:hypothetical protein
MSIVLSPQTSERLKEAAHYTNLPEARLAELLIIDGLDLFLDAPEEFKHSFDDE